MKRLLVSAAVGLAVFFTTGCSPALRRSPLMGCKMPPAEMETADGAKVYTECKEDVETRTMVCVTGPAMTFGGRVCYLRFKSTNCGPLELLPTAVCVDRDLSKQPARKPGVDA